MSDITVSSDADDTKRRRVVLLLAVAGAGIVAGLLGYFLVLPLFGSPASDEPFVVAAKPKVSTSASPSPSPSATTLRAFAGTIGRDPFKPLLNEKAGTASGSGTAAGSGTATAAPAAPAAATTPAWINVLDVTQEANGPVVTLRLDTAVHLAAAGETVADVVKVVSIKGTAVTFLYGEQQFTLKKGQAKKLG